MTRACTVTLVLSVHVNSCVCRGVGCIYVEMVSGVAIFPGEKDIWDQLNKIWQVCIICECVIALTNYDVGALYSHSSCDNCIHAV